MRKKITAMSSLNPEQQFSLLKTSFESEKMADKTRRSDPRARTHTNAYNQIIKMSDLALPHVVQELKTGNILFIRAYLEITGVNEEIFEGNALYISEETLAEKIVDHYNHNLQAEGKETKVAVVAVSGQCQSSSGFGSVGDPIEAKSMNPRGTKIY